MELSTHIIRFGYITPKKFTHNSAMH